MSESETKPSKRPTPEQMVQAVLCLLESLPVDDRYLDRLRELIEGEYERRARAQRRSV